MPGPLDILHQCRQHSWPYKTEVESVKERTNETGRQNEMKKEAEGGSERDEIRKKSKSRFL